MAATVPIETTSLDQLRDAAVKLLQLTSTNGTKAASEALFAAVERIEKERAAHSLAQAIVAERPAMEGDNG